MVKEKVTAPEPPRLDQTKAMYAPFIAFARSWQWILYKSELNSYIYIIQANTHININLWCVNCIFNLNCQFRSRNLIQTLHIGFTGMWNRQFYIFSCEAVIMWWHAPSGLAIYDGVMDVRSIKWAVNMSYDPCMSFVCDTANNTQYSAKHEQQTVIFSCDATLQLCNLNIYLYKY